MKANARKQLARRVRLLRTNRGWSQEVLAELSGLNRSYIGAVERAEHNIGLDNIERISRALETSIPKLLDGEEPTQHRFPSQPGTLPPAAGTEVVVHRKVFLELLRQCGQTHRELVLVYLERCGVRVRD
jgi:transcriptional regulator with XRE-family HTH domain